MATFSKTDSWSNGNKKQVCGTLTLGTYATGGEAVAASLFGLKKITHLNVAGPAFKSDYTDAVLPTWVRSTGKVAVYQALDPANAGGANVKLQELGAGSLSSYSVEVTVLGF